MRRYRMIYTALATFAALAIVVSGVAYAASVFTKTIDASVNITGTAGLSFYSNSSATSPISTLSFGDVAQNSSGSVTFYVKNTGTVAQTVSAGPSSLSTSVGTVSLTFDGAANRALAVNAVATVVATIQTASGASIGSTGFTIAVDGTSGSTTTTAPPTTTTTTTTAPPTTTTTSTVTPVSYSATIQPMLAAGCSCHVAGTTAPRLNTYSAVYSQRNNLPGMGANYLTTSQENTLALWISQGALNN